jgi:enediyne biosynthesis protein E4
MTRRFCILGSLVAVLLLVGGYLLWHFNPWKAKEISVAPPIAPARERQAVPVPAVHFTDVTEAAGIRFRHFNGALGQKLLPETMGAGVAVLDFDGDGLQDLIFVNGCPWPGSSNPDTTPCLTLYRNRGDGTFEDITAQAGLMISLYGMGVTVGDIDNDGFPDLFVTGVGGNHLFHNVAGPGGKRRFVDITSAAGVSGPGGWPGAVSSTQFLAWNKPVAFGSSATFFDYDGDGRLDLFVCYYVNWSPAKDLAIDSSLTGIGRSYQQPTQFEGAVCKLYRNLDGLHFKDVSAETGVEVIEREGTDQDARQRAIGKSLGVVVCDPDEDGWPDIVVANDSVRNFFFHNVKAPDGGRRFIEEGLLTNVAYAEGRARGAMGIDWGEYRTGKNALLIGNFANEPDTFLTLDNPKRLLFSDAALAVGLAGPSRRPLKFGAMFFDYDNDGRLDALTCNGHLEPEIAQVQAGQTYAQPVQLFWNTGDSQRQFEPVTEASAGPDLFRPLVGRGCAFLDFNNDGRLDIVLTANNGAARLLRNDGAPKNHWLRLVLSGDGKRSNTSAIGAQVVVETGGRILRRQVTGGRGYLSQSELPITIGLGETAVVDKVTVRWPGKDATIPETWTNLEADKGYELKQGEAAPRLMPAHKKNATASGGAR